MDFLEHVVAALAERYRVERELGRGGMAIVLLAEDLKHRRLVAIKLLKPELSAILGSERFLREIEIVAALQHPHILPLYDSGEITGLLYYVMPFAEGESLRQRLTREQQLPLDVALRITEEVGNALQYAHDRGVVHRDIKPDNIMLTGGQAIVADFGIARALQAADADVLTQSGVVVGTPQYMSPEQAAGTVDSRSDQYSLACTLYEMLIGQPPFTGPTSQAVMARHSLDPVPGLRVVRQTVPAAVESAIMRAMAKLPADRFPSMQRFLDALKSRAIETAEPHTSAARRSLPGARPKNRWRLIAGLAGLVLVGILTWLLLSGRQSGRPGEGGRAIITVAVLPFHDLTVGADSSYLGQAMTEELIDDLAEVGSLRVLSRNSGSVAQETGRSLFQLANELGIEAVVKGSIGKVGDSIRVKVQVLEAPDSTVLLVRDYHGPLGKLPDLQREITTAIATSIHASLKGTERNRLAMRREVDQRAYDAYLRGRFHLERDEVEPARLLFEQANRIAPDWAQPYVGLANYYTSLPFFSDVSPAEVLPKARAALVQALHLDETLAEAHAAQAYIRAYYEWDWRAAEQEFRRAIELRPNYADAYFSYSRFLASRRRFDEAIAQLERAVELDPLSPPLQVNRALLDYFAGRYVEADKRLQELLKGDSSDVLAKWGLALVAEQEGRPKSAVAILEPISGNNLNRKSSLGHAYALAGRSASARRVLAELQGQAARSYVPSYFFALVHTGLGESDEALRYLERAYQERSTVLAYLLIDPRLAPLRSEPRFLDLARKLSGE